MLKCRKCAAHDIEIPVRGHARTCPFRMCPCNKCVKVVSKRLSSVKRRYKNTDVVFVNVECNSGNVRVQAIPKTLIDSLKLTKDCQISSSGGDSVTLEKMDEEETTRESSFTTPPPSLPEEEQQQQQPPSPPVPEASMVFYNMMQQYLPYFRMSMEQQLNLLSTYAWIMQSAKFVEEMKKV